MSVLLVNADGPEKRVALVDGGVLAELHIERQSDGGIVGNIYNGRVARVLPGMQAAFVDIGIGKAAFLYADDFSNDLDDSESYNGSTPTPTQLAPSDTEKLRQPQVERVPIEHRVHEGQEIMVQVAKEPIGTKGARITGHISLPARTLVLMPTVDHVGISRRITDDAERERLRALVEALRPPATGFIVRTASEGQLEEKLRADMELLTKLWEDIRNRAQTTPTPGLVYQDLDLTLRAVRDIVSADVQRLIIDDAAEYERVSHFVATFMPRYRSTLELYHGVEPLFDAHGIEHQLDHALDRKVWLKSGGYLVIDESEALTAIDVNTGRYVGLRNLEDTITKINLEAVKEIVVQLRVRNLGGLIVVDFIDMELEANRQKIWRALKDSLAEDRARTNVLPLSPLGLVEMTRQRVRESLAHQLSEACPYCQGRGFVKTATTVCFEVLREIHRQAENLPGHALTVWVHPDVADLLADAEREHLVRLERRINREVLVEPKSGFHVERFEIHVQRRPDGDPIA